MRLGHVHLPGITPYSAAAKIQAHFAKALLRSKASASDAQDLSTAVPDPVVLTAEFSPVFTYGRRANGNVSEAHRRYLRSTGADVVETLRGGQTTFHGPGQLVAYAIIDLRRHFRPRRVGSHDGAPSGGVDTGRGDGTQAGMSARAYVSLLEDSLIGTVERYGLSGAHRKTEYPGVWIDRDRKIASVGVHLRRHVASHGVALNVETQLSWFEHITACGIADVKMTSVEREMREAMSEEMREYRWRQHEQQQQQQRATPLHRQPPSVHKDRDLSVSIAARIFVEEFASRWLSFRDRHPSDPLAAGDAGGGRGRLMTTTTTTAPARGEAVHGDFNNADRDSDGDGEIYSIDLDDINVES